MLEEKISEWTEHAFSLPGELQQRIKSLKNLIENEFMNQSSDYYTYSLSRVKLIIA